MCYVLFREGGVESPLWWGPIWAETERKGLSQRSEGGNFLADGT